MILEKNVPENPALPMSPVPKEDKNPEDDSRWRSEALEDILSELKLLKQKSKNMTLQETLEISSGSLKHCSPHSLEELPWHFLRKVLALNVSARNTNLDQGTAGGEGVRGMDKEKTIDDRVFNITERDIDLSMNPLDVLCALLLCSDSFLQQDILSKMSLCQFALPLLLPPLETSKCTLMIWAMRDIVKKWRPHSLAGSRGFREENLVLIPMPIISLSSYRLNDFEVNDDNLQLPWLKYLSFNLEARKMRIQEISLSLIYKYISYMDEKISSKRDYVSTYCGELLSFINQNLQEDDVKKLNTTSAFEVDLKLHILGESAYKFQQMHKDFIEENDHQKRLEQLKPHYFSIFKDLYQKKDAQQIRAKGFCDRCLHPALEEHINKRLGIEIIDQFRNSERSMECSGRNFFQFTLLKELLDKWNFDQYVESITNYEQFVKNWIQKRVIDSYIKNENLKNLEKDILSGVIAKVKNALDILSNKEIETFSNFVDNISLELQKALAISKSKLVGLELRSAFDPSNFSAYVENYLQDLQKEILSTFESLDIESKLSRLSVKPQDEIFKQVFGCGKQCPFCKVPCEAGGAAHKEHFAAVHRPKGLGTYRYDTTKKLVIDICSSSVASQVSFRCPETNWEWHPYKDYRKIFPDWCIQPDPSLNASDYWKFVLKEFNNEFSKKYECKPADLPKDWKQITKEQALQALKESYNMK
nr:PREDICTED: interferon-induced very large GTPase 1 [Anolis carolinensis]XP_016850905.1 PREDICTED: interferon-induced very large GTPase 1 [Anolis carolinensis]|eukprot:XP_008113619.1 PREDICTED: interferon-induced very large GTPase 1 [Anolis carolinensis]